MFLYGCIFYILSEYSPRIAKLYTDSPIGDLVDLLDQYYWGGNTVPFVAGQVVTYLKVNIRRKRNDSRSITR